MSVSKLDKDIQLFILVASITVISLLLLGFLGYHFVALDAECKTCKRQKQYYIDKLIEGNTNIARADSILDANGMFNPKDTTWQKSK